MAHMIPRSKDVAEIPEILTMIFNMLTIGQLVPVLRVNKLFFDCGAPLVWRTVWGLEVLLQLLTGNTLPVIDSTFDAPKLNQLLVQDKLPRFKLYCEMVRTLHTHCHFTRGYHWLNLDILLPHAPLLPHLKEVVVKDRRDRGHSKMLPTILALCCGSSYTVLRAGRSLGPSVPWVNPTDCVRVLATLATRIARMQHLDLFVTGRELPDGNHIELAAALRQMLSLKSLGLGCYSICNTVLAAAGQIQGLQSLTLRFHHDSDVDMANLQIPDGSFTKLSILVIWGAWPSQLFHLFKLQPLISKIQSAVLDVFEGSIIDRYLDKAFEILRDGAECLEELDLFFPSLTQEPYEIWSDRLLLIISDIPLKHIRMRHVCLSWGQGPFDEFLERCNTWQKTLVQFIMPDQPALPNDLVLFARFRALEVLSVNLQVVDVPAVQQLGEMPISAQTLRFESYFRLHELQPETVYNLAV
ncbi:hypothetical protein FRC10_000343 [Ceratobasidium sp. 414]|nr:hypothetical protein FRC10_000343 [Ceratobasidium sp. 414]